MTDDYLQEPPSGFQQFQPPPPAPEVPFTQADSLRMQKLNQALSAAENQVGDGTLTGEQGDEFKRLIMGQLSPLQARQEADQKKNQQKALQQALEQSAQQESVLGVHRQHRAQRLQEEVVPYVDPLSGAVAHLIQNHDGDWDEIEFKRHQAEQDAKADDQPELGDQLSKPESSFDEPEIVHGPEGEIPPGVHMTTSDPQAHVITINNGERQQVYEFGRTPNGGYTGPQLVYDSRPDQPAGKSELVTQQEIAQISQRAREALSRYMKPGPHFDHTLGSLIQSQVGDLQRQREHRRGFGEKELMAQRRQEEKEKKEFTVKHHSDLLRHFEAEIQKEKQHYEKTENSLLKKPGYFDTPATEFAEARRRAAQHLEELGLNLPGEGRKPAEERQAAPAPTASQETAQRPPGLRAPPPPGPDLAREQDAKLSELDKRLNRPDLTFQEKVEAKAALVRLRGMVQANGGDLNHPSIKEEARKYAEILRRHAFKPLPEQQRPFRAGGFTR